MSMLSRFAGIGGGVPPVYVEDVFSTYLYTGDGTSNRAISNGIDLSGIGGMVWIKQRSGTSNHVLWDTARGLVSAGGGALNSNTTDASGTQANLTAFNSDGFSVGNFSTTNTNAGLYASWAFRKASKFFDAVTYTGTGSARTISHNLGSVPGCIIVKRTDTTGDWQVYHRSLANTEYLVLNSTAAKQTGATRWNSTTPTSTDFSLGTDATVNANGGTYVAYLFAHDAGGFGESGADNVVSCGSFTTDASGNATISLGYEPQWVISKRSSGAAGWEIFDAMRGMTVAGLDDALLYANTTAAEVQGTNLIAPNATGFSVSNEFTSSDYVYIAIRRPNKVPTSGTSVFSPTVYTGTNVDNRLIDTTIAPDWVWIRQRNDTAITGMYTGARLTGQEFLMTGRNDAAATDPDSFDAQIVSTTEYGNAFSAMNGVWVGNDPSRKFNTNTTSNNHVIHAFKRAQEFFDVVCYTGTGSNTTISHNLGVAPEWMIVKRRNTTGNWVTYYGLNTHYININSNVGGASASDVWNNTSPTASVFSLGTNGSVNTSGGTYIAYLFASCPGVSKVGTYIGTGVGTVNSINCGFSSSARFVMIKRIDESGNWYVWDSARGVIAGNDPYLLLDSTAAEVTSTDYVDTTSTGFELSTTAPAALNATITDTWISRTSGFSTNAILDVTYGNGLYVAVGATGRLTTSSDAITWTVRTSTFGSDNINGVTYGNGVYVAVGEAGSCASSTDGVTWTSRLAQFSGNAIFGVTYGNGVFVAVGNLGKLSTSTNGTTWTARTASFGNSDIQDVIYGNGIFVAVAASGKIGTSTDGITWTSQTSGVAVTLRSVVYGNGLFVAVGDSGTMLTSADGVTWTSRTSGFGTTNILDVTYGGSFFVAVGASGTMTASTDGITWTSRTSGFGTTAINGVVYGSDLFVAGGNSGTMTTSEPTEYLYLAIA